MIFALIAISSDLEDGPFWIVFQMEASITVPARPKRYIEVRQHRAEAQSTEHRPRLR